MATSLSGARGPRLRRRRRTRARSPQLPGDHGDRASFDRRRRAEPAVGMASLHSIEKCGVDHLVLGRQVEPDLEQLQRIRRLAVDQREHLRVHDAAAGGQPLHVAVAEARRRAQRIRVIDQPAPHDGHRLEAAVRDAGGSRGRPGRGTCASRCPDRSPGRGRAPPATPRAPSARCRRDRRRRGARRRGRDRTSPRESPAS